MTPTEVYVCPDGTEFPFAWPREEMAEHSWRWDQMHCPLPMTPLSGELGQFKLDGMADGQDDLGVPAVPRSIVANGYRFMRAIPVLRPPSVQNAIREHHLATYGSNLIERFNSVYRPEVEFITGGLVNFAIPGSTLKSLVERFDQVEAANYRLGYLHSLAFAPTAPIADRFIDFCKAEFGAQGDQFATEAMAGLPNKSLESANGLWQLSRLANELPAVAAAFRDQPPASLLPTLRDIEGGKEFAHALETYLADFGLRSESFSELGYPTWQEDPRFAMFLVRRYIDLPESGSPEALHHATAKLREQRTAEAEARLGDDPEKLETFRGLQRDAFQRTILIEDHNFYIDQRGMTSLRFPCLAIGREAARQGSIDSPEDVFYLRTSELREAALDPARRFQQSVAERRAERDRWMRVLPPTFVGAGAFNANITLDRFFGTFDKEPDPPGTVRGIPGSAGVVRGIARKVLDLNDVDRLGFGEILVTYATAPPWTPVFAIAGGIVTDAGGVLSHCAVVAREYGIPAVVGCRTATSAIEDGQMITVDGTTGVVTIDG